jgi:hypothetical protein
MRIPVRSFGSEVSVPSVEGLAAWVARRRGQEADLVTYLLEQSLEAQSGVEIPAAGGLFYATRWLEGLAGFRDGVLVGEPGIEPDLLIGDALRVRGLRKGAWLALPAPHLLGLQDEYIQDEEEFCELVATLYARLAREMRDAGVAGHVLIADEANAIELEVLAKKKIVFFPRKERGFDLEMLLEYQGDLIVPAERLEDAVGLLERYRIRRLVLMNPESDHLAAAASFIDAEMLQAGGYCEESCPDYWVRRIEQAFLTE